MSQQVNPAGALEPPDHRTNLAKGHQHYSLFQFNALTTGLKLTKGHRDIQFLLLFVANTFSVANT